jgi:hypothetical protein
MEIGLGDVNWIKLISVSRFVHVYGTGFESSARYQLPCHSLELLSVSSVDCTYEYFGTDPNSVPLYSYLLSK